MMKNLMKPIKWGKRQHGQGNKHQDADQVSGNAAVPEGGTEDRLRESDILMDSIFSAITDLVVLIDRDYRIVKTNRATCNSAGKVAEDVVGMHCYEILQNEQNVCEGCPAKRVLEKGKPSSAEIKRIGDDTVAAVSAFPVFNADKTVDMVVVHARDITEERSLQEQLLQSQRLESIGRLTGGIAHDFNNILQGIIGYTSLLLATDELTEQQAADLEKITQLADRAVQMTKQLLLFSRKTSTEAIPLDLNELVAETAAVVDRTMAKQISVETVLDRSIGTIDGNPGQIQQVLMNLCINARDAMPDGGKLTIETRTLTFDEQYCHIHPDARPGSFVAIAVSDDGVGMDAQTQGRIFEPFFTTKEPTEGTGLGLSVTYGIVKNHGGFISVHSEPGLGTTVQVCLPRRPAVDKSTLSAEPAEVPGGTETVLIADDEAAILDLSGRWLEERGYRVVLAQSGEEAVEIFDKKHDEISLVVLDLAMPGIDGIEAFKKVKEIEPGVRVIFCSGSAVDQVTEQIRHEGANAVLSKPYTLDELAQTVRKVLD